jgi:hypothetical protein
MVLLRDEASPHYTYGVPGATPTVYLSLEAAKDALKAAAARFPSFQQVLYGEAYPFENTTFDQVLATRQQAIYGWGIILPEDEDDLPEKVAVVLVIAPIQ